MSNLIPGNQKHLSLQDRLYIEKTLSSGSSFKDIACFLCKAPVTISKEIKNIGSVVGITRGSFYNAHNVCIHRYHCRKTNGCDKALHKCTIPHKYQYDAQSAERKYKETLSFSRSGINMTKTELTKKDKLVSHLVYQGQSPYPIVANHPELDLSVRSAYTHIDKGLFTARNIDLKRKAKFRPRKSHKTPITNREVFSGRMYSDFHRLFSTILTDRGSEFGVPDSLETGI